MTIEAIKEKRQFKLIVTCEIISSITLEDNSTLILGRNKDNFLIIQNFDGLSIDSEPKILWCSSEIDSSEAIASLLRWTNIQNYLIRKNRGISLEGNMPI